MPGIEGTRWFENIELQQILGQGAQYGLADFALAPAAAPAPAMTPVMTATMAPGADAGATLDALERVAIAGTLARFNGNISHAAKTLGISRAALYRKLDKHGI